MGQFASSDNLIYSTCQSAQCFRVTIISILQDQQGVVYPDIYYGNCRHGNCRHNPGTLIRVTVHRTLAVCGFYISVTLLRVQGLLRYNWFISYLTGGTLIGVEMWRVFEKSAIFSPPHNFGRHNFGRRFFWGTNFQLWLYYHTYFTSVIPIYRYGIYCIPWDYTGETGTTIQAHPVTRTHCECVYCLKILEVYLFSLFQNKLMLITNYNGHKSGGRNVAGFWKIRHIFAPSQFRPPLFVPP